MVPRPDEALHVMTFKSMVDIESKPYIEDDFTLDEKVQFDEYGARVHRAPPLNRIRYRFDYHHTGTDLAMESNARIVRCVHVVLLAMLRFVLFRPQMWEEGRAPHIDARSVRRV